jgi:hypothetical protein
MKPHTELAKCDVALAIHTRRWPSARPRHRPPSVSIAASPLNGLNGLCQFGWNGKLRANWERTQKPWLRAREISKSAIVRLPGWIPPQNLLRSRSFDASPRRCTGTNVDKWSSGVTILELVPTPFSISGPPPLPAREFASKQINSGSSVPSRLVFFHAVSRKIY